MQIPTRPAQHAASYAQRHPLETLGRFGYAVKGAVYVLLGVLALDAALGGGSPEGQEGALTAIASTSYGGVLLWVITAGLAAYALWRFALAALDPEGEGTDAQGVARRIGYVISGVAYAFLAWTAYKVRSGASGSGGSSAQERTQTLLQQPFGPWLVGLVGLGILAYGCFEFYRASSGSFMDRLRLEGTASGHRQTIRRIGQAGLAARGVVYLVIGGFLLVAALQSDPSEARGLDGALRALQDQPFGPYLLGIVAIGLAAYGVYCFVNARYRTYEGLR